MLRSILPLTLVLGLAAAPAAAVAAEGAAGTPLRVAEIGSFHIGGRPVTLSGLPTREIVFTAGAPPFVVDPNGDFETGQMYVHFVRLADPDARYPLLMWHGGGLSGAMWETKPDGEPGWQMYFLDRGHDTYVSDAVERGRASWSRYPEIYEAEPFFRTKEEGWELFRIGPEGSYATDRSSPPARPTRRRPTSPGSRTSRTCSSGATTSMGIRSGRRSCPGSSATAPRWRRPVPRSPGWSCPSGASPATPT